MAVDTERKRKSFIGFGLTADAGLLPVPDGSFDEGDRKVLLGLIYQKGEYTQISFRIYEDAV